MYKLDPDDFKTEYSVEKLVKYLKESPLNRQPLPDAGNKIGGYYRRLNRRPNEALPAFLIREDKTHDDMLRALQRLLRERELSFEDYDTSQEELKKFCGMKEGESVYFGPPEGTDAEEEEAEAAEEEEFGYDDDEGRASWLSSGASRTSRTSRTTTGGKGSTKTKPPRGKDLLERLMEKGLMPLSALDVIRGWMILEMSTSTEEERRIVKAATRNRLGYQEVKQALLAMYEDRGKGGGRPFAAGKSAMWGEMETEADAAYAGAGMTGVEAMAIQKGIRDDGRCYFTWVPSDLNLADCLTKATAEAFKVAALYHERKAWVVRFNEEFVSARKQQRLRKTKQDLEAKLITARVWPADDFEDDVSGMTCTV
ncbi:CACNA1B, partial [Symbiodinium sp. CCMP2456]